MADGLYDTSGWIIDQSEFSEKGTPPKAWDFSFSSRNNQSPQDRGVEETKGDSPDPMEDSTALSDENARNYFRQFFGTTVKAAPPSGRQRTNRISTHHTSLPIAPHLKEPLIAEVSEFFFPRHPSYFHRMKSRSLESDPLVD